MQVLSIPKVFFSATKIFEIHSLSSKNEENWLEAECYYYSK